MRGDHLETIFMEVNNMKIEEMTPDEIEIVARRQKADERIALFDEFIASGYRYGKITDIPEGRKPENLASSLSTSAKRYWYGIKVHRKRDLVYLERMF